MNQIFSIPEKNMIRYYENTFWHNCITKYLTLDNILKALCHGLIKEEQLPKNISDDLTQLAFQKIIHV